MSRHRDAPASPLVVLTPTDDVGRSIRTALLRQGTGQTGMWITTPTQFARVLGRTHPSARTARLVGRGDTFGILMDALKGISERVRDQLFQGESLESVVEAMVPVVRRLRENDISPATLYALSLGRSLSPAHRALVVGYEAYDRELLNGPMAGPSDVFGWATAQVRNGRISWLGQTTIVSFDDTTVGAAGATFLNAIRREARSFVRLGDPISSTHAPSAALASHMSSDAPPSADAPAPQTGAVEGSEETGGVRVDSLRAAVEWIQTQMDEEALDASSIEIAAPADLLDELEEKLHACGIRAAVHQENPDAVSLTSFDRAGFSRRHHFVAVAAAEEIREKGSMSLLTKDDWARLAELSEAPVAPETDAEAARRWQMSQVLWRHEGRATVLGIDTSLPEGVGKDAGEVIGVTGTPDAGSAATVRTNQTHEESIVTEALRRWVVDAVSVYHVPGELERIGQTSHLCSLLPDEAQDDAVDRLESAVRRLLNAGFSEWLADAVSVHPAPANCAIGTDGEWVQIPIHVAIRRPAGWCLLSISDIVLDGEDPSEAAIQDAVHVWSEATGQDVVLVARFGESSGWTPVSVESTRPFS
ncbi:hypothetical protein [Longibacter salinarum]|uniref:hypothetical protein n=1 Tax=Longibacter salinarum TaxID=1850348 RepID=UPI00117F59A5|nr:hypothetical protein [Longibacter salinarum]